MQPILGGSVRFDRTSPAESNLELVFENQRVCRLMWNKINTMIILRRFDVASRQRHLEGIPGDPIVRTRSTRFVN